MTSVSRPFGRPPTYPLREMAVGDQITLPAPTSADIKRICRNVSQFAQRNERGYRCRSKDGVMTVTRVR